MPKQSQRLGVGIHETVRWLRGVYPEQDSSVAMLPQNDRKRRARNDNRAYDKNDREVKRYPTSARF